VDIRQVIVSTGNAKESNLSSVNTDISLEIQGSHRVISKLLQPEKDVMNFAVRTYSTSHTFQRKNLFRHISIGCNLCYLTFWLIPNLCVYVCICELKMCTRSIMGGRLWCNVLLTAFKGLMKVDVKVLSGLVKLLQYLLTKYQNTRIHVMSVPAGKAAPRAFMFCTTRALADVIE
jgi:hypothetical protein